jgi:PAS domain S-box-containing protein
MPDLPAVLLVDDRSENLLALEAVLEPLPCRCVSVTSGEDALKALLQDEFACVLLDVQMPGMDGFETAQLIKGRERTRSVPIIFVTAISKDREHVFHGYSSGAVDYLFKPYDPQVLRSKVNVFLELDAKSRAAAQSEAILRAAFDYAPIGKARVDLEGRIAEVNRALAGLLGHQPADLHDRVFDTLLHPDDLESDAERRSALMAGALSRYDHEARLVDAKGGEVPCALSFSLASPGGGVPDQVIVQVQDLRDRLQAQAEREQLILEQAARAQAEQLSQRLEAVQRISDAALSSLGFEDLVRELLQRTVDVLHVDTAAVELHDEGVGSAVNSTVFQIAGGVEAGMQKRSWSPSPNGSGKSETHPLGGSIASAIRAPLRADGRAIGAMHVGTLFERAFSADDVTMLGVAADRAAMAIERVRLFEREHMIAEALQRSLLPPGPANVPGLVTAAHYRPAGAGSQVGGDWYDTVVQPDGTLLLVIGDVAGRGINAASTMGQLRSALRAYAFDGHSPGSLLERLNLFMNGMRDRGMATVALVSVDPVAGRIAYAKAGHPPALLVAPGGACTWLDDAAGVPLGVIDEAEYAEGTAALEPGSTLILYTDGLIEMRGESLDRGFERLEAAAASGPEDPDRLVEHVLEHTLADPDIDDDVTLLVLRTQG